MKAGIRLFAAMALLQFAFCTIDLAGNSAETGNPRVTGTVCNPDGSPLDGQLVTLRKVTISSSGEVTRYESTVLTNEQGLFEFNSVSEGNYVVYCASGSSGTQAINSNVEVNPSSGTIHRNLDLLPAVCIKGSVTIGQEASLSNVKVLVPGAKISAQVSAQGSFFLADAPRGVYDLSFIINTQLGSAVNYLKIKVNTDAADTVYVGDIDLALCGDSSAVLYSYHETSVDSSFALNPAFHVLNPDLSSVIFYRIDESRNPEPVVWPKPIWRFSLLVGVHEGTVTTYGGPDAIRDSISFQLDRINSRFNYPGVFDGIFQFAMDSLYIYSGSSSAELLTAPSPFDYKLLINRFETEVAGGYYYNTQTVAHFPPVSFTGDMFDASRADVCTYLLALARGARGLDRYAVDTQDNPVNSGSYQPPLSIMFYPYGVSNWDEWNVNLINHYADSSLFVSDIHKRAIPESLALKVMGTNEQISGGVTVEFFPVVDRAVLSIPAHVQNISSAQGIPFSKDLFVDSRGNVTWMHLVRASTVSDTVYNWLLLSDINNAWFEGLQEFTFEMNLN